MSDIYAGEQGRQGELEDLVRQGVLSALMETHTSLPCRVQDFNTSTQQATVIPEIWRQYEDQNGEIQAAEIAAIEEVPVIYPRGGGLALTWPLQPGDKALLVFAERSLADWKDASAPGVPTEARIHDYSDAVLIPGLFPQAEKLAGISADTFDIRTEDGLTKIGLGATGILHTTDRIHIFVGTGDFVVDLTGGKINLGDGVFELLQVLQTAINLIGTSTVGGLPLSNAAAIAIEELKVLALRT